MAYLCPLSAARWSGVSPLVSVQLMFTGFNASKLEKIHTQLKICQTMISIKRMIMKRQKRKLWHAQGNKVDSQPQWVTHVLFFLKVESSVNSKAELKSTHTATAGA
jgi:hypothetical protein